MEPYRRTRARVSALFLDATPDALTRTVPACPAWSVHDLAAHLAGVPATLAAGDFPSGDVDEWLQGIVDERCDAQVDDLMQEWKGLDAAIEPMLQGMGSLMFTDVSIHEHDLRGALGAPDHAALEVDAVMACGMQSFAQPLQDAGLDAIVVEHDGQRVAHARRRRGLDVVRRTVGGDARARQSPDRRRAARTPVRRRR